MTEMTSLYSHPGTPVLAMRQPAFPSLLSARSHSPDSPGGNSCNKNSSSFGTAGRTNASNVISPYRSGTTHQTKFNRARWSLSRTSASLRPNGRWLGLSPSIQEKTDSLESWRWRLRPRPSLDRSQNSRYYRWPPMTIHQLCRRRRAECWKTRLVRSTTIIHQLTIPHLYRQLEARTSDSVY